MQSPGNKKNILIINGHPNKDSFCYALATAYQEAAMQSGASVTTLNIAELNFDPNLQYGYTKRMELEPDLLASLDKIKHADHLVWVHPVWWGGFPAIMKGFIDRLFLPGLTYKYRENSLWWDKLLVGKTARIITTIDQPAWYYRLVYGNPSINQLKKSTLEFCGIKPVKVTAIGIIKTADPAKRASWLNKVSLLGSKHK
ncbi:NAD(P)H-dependent oxidoreductase [Pedobacter nyackensis]|uniref:Putative NADPH-quinone reductase (Modulator of drug activity B) n=1 Tax=Pedobacter nyackensis TaxID=475255 RepID=A0A1W2DLH4_9SPHI|nr:NAD(P)H-dependent oxidoreductase [Pedobacter nyackensis]SMC98299.1 Putative NADPH-quinone reductase (modulator of drug activity B) [Pedobacter nyackensis]